MLMVIESPGALFDYTLRREISPPEFLWILVLLLLIAGVVLRRLVCGSWNLRFRPIGGAVVAFSLAALLAQLAAPAFMSQVFAEVDDVGVLIPRPGSRRFDCIGASGVCHEYVLNELGFRGEPVDRTTPDSRLIVFIGDSFIFGSGVDDDKTVPAAVAHKLSDLRPEVVVVNGGIQGLSARSFGDIVRYTKSRLHPDIVAVLVKDDDIDDTDMLSRWDRFRRNFWFRMLFVMNLESVYETGRLLWRYYRGSNGRRELLAQHLAAIANAAVGAKLLLVAAAADDMRSVFSEWAAAHPDVLYIWASEDRNFTQADRIPGDGHWSETGCDTIAAILARPLREALAPAEPHL